MTIDKTTLELVRRALAEDIGAGDVTTESTVPADHTSSGRIVAKAPGVVAGLGVARAVFEELDANVVFEPAVNDGARVAPGDVVARVGGSTRAILTGERTALNFLQRLSGVATAASEYAAALEGSGARVLDTRKTTPGMRVLEKYAVSVGGGGNHRAGLWDMVLIKDNHIAAAGGIERAVELARAAHGDLAVEVEVCSLGQVREALAAGVDRMMLDNMSLDSMREAISLSRAADAAPEIEISGGVTGDGLAAVAALGPDFISVGALTHSARALDLSLELGSDS